MMILFLKIISLLLSPTFSSLVLFTFYSSDTTDISNSSEIGIFVLDDKISSSWISLGDSIGCLSLISMIVPTFLKKLFNCNLSI